MIQTTNLYEVVSRETDDILDSFDKPAKNASLSTAIDAARENFKSLQAEAKASLKELTDAAEWNAFTIAFYGETNAGKSTIIETLRIMMGEETKRAQQSQFRSTLSELGLDSESIQTFIHKKKDISDLTEALYQSKKTLTESLTHRNPMEALLAERESTLLRLVQGYSIWRRLLSFFWKIPEASALLEAKEQLRIFQSEKESLLRLHENEASEINAKIASITAEIAHIQKAIDLLTPLEDGSIIGDGTPDFTRESTSYEFNVNNTKIILLDVPGIEGKEELVQKPIMEAVRKAHAVFYVTRKADPPQKGDERSEKKGTLEKIKEHLGAQTEVWAIFNKSIKSAEQLRMPSLVNEGERGGLLVLEQEMRNQLGNNYAGLLPVSAYPAFLASTDHLIPGGQKAKDKKKFSSVLDSEKILQKTGFQDLTKKLSSEMAENSRQKIRRSNFNKANQVVMTLKDNVDALIRQHFSPLYKKLEEESHSATLQLESATDALRNNLESEAVASIDKQNSLARAEIYKKIEKDIGNDEFKSSLNDCIEKYGKQLEKELPKLTRKNIDRFKEEVQGIFDQFQEHIQTFLKDASHTNPFEFDLRINIDSGLNIPGLIGVAIGAAMLWWNPAGWILGTIAAVGLLISFVKAVRSLLSSEYKKSQQRKSADENLERVFDAVKSDYLSQVKKSVKDLEKNLEDIKSEFHIPATQAHQIVKSLSASSRRLEGISQRIIKEGEL